MADLLSFEHIKDNYNIMSFFLLLAVTPSLLTTFPGDTVVIPFFDVPAGGLQAESAFFDGQPASFFKYQGSYRLIFGIPASKAPGNYQFRVKFSDGKVFEKQISVKAKRFPKVVLGIPKRLNLTPSGLTAKLAQENKAVAKAIDIKSEEILFSGPFGLPLRDNRKVESVFGEIRQTGEEQIRHLGVDFGASSGAAVAAINHGVVRRAYYDTVYGNSVILDHGQGIYSLYFHLDKIRVKEGQKMKRGQLIGTVGQTGYATSPHLHLSIKINGVSVDPFKFVASLK